jgi:lipoprotein-anchoring transpeptidase ErfK/SrfK
MKPEDFDEIRRPGRKPWLVIILLVVAGALVFQCYERRARTGHEQDKPAPQKQSQVVAQRTAAIKTCTPSNNVARIPVPQKPVQSKAGVIGLSEAKTLEEQGDLLNARSKYAQLLADTGDAGQRSEIEKALGRINVELVVTPRAMPEKVEYVVKKNDSIDKIAKKLGATKDLIEKSNNIPNADLIKAGDYIRVFTGRFSIAVSKARNDLVLSMNDAFFKRYLVGTGKFGKTPIGTFVVEDKVKEPPWWRPGEPEIPYGSTNNILGTRWMALRATGTTPDVKGYGIHGTWNDASIGKAESAGCIRMRNADVEELFMMVPPGTPVVIAE